MPTCGLGGAREGERYCSGEQQRANWGEGELALYTSGKGGYIPRFPVARVMLESGAWSRTEHKDRSE